MKQNFLKRFLKENNLKAIDVYSKTGQNKNTFTKWMRADNDAMLPQSFILKLLTEFPEINLIEYFPTYGEIIKLSKDRK